MADAVLDASALIAFLREEPGAEKVAKVLTRSCISGVNLAETLGKMVEYGKPLEAVGYDPARAIAFYETVFGWKFTKWDGPMPYWLISTGEGEPGIDGGLVPRRDPAQPCVNTVNVADVDASLETVLRGGGKLCLPKMAVPGVGWLVYCNDTEGHVFGMMQNDPAAR